MSACGCERGGDCTKTTVCHGQYEADKLAEALDALIGAAMEALVGAENKTLAWATGDVLTDAREALKDYRE